MRRFFKYAKKKASGHTDRRSLGSVGSLASVSVASSSDHGSVYSLTGENFGYSIDLKATDKSFTKLHKACWLNDFEKVKKHIKKDGVNAVDEEKRTPLHLACARGLKDIIWFLLGSKAEINVRDADGCTPLLKIIQCHHTSIVQFLIDRGADLKITDLNGNSGLHLAAKEGLLDVASILLDKGINVDAVNKDGKSALHLATETNNIKMVELLLLHGASVNIQDTHLRTSLTVAAEIGSEEIVKFFLEYGADTTLVDSKGWTCQAYAKSANHLNCLELLSEQTTNQLSDIKQENTLHLGPVIDTNSEQDGHVGQQIIESDKENSFPGSFADSWSDSSDEEPKKVILKDLNLTKFLASVDVSDAETSDMEDKKNIVIAPPKPPRSQNNNGKNASESEEKENRPENVPVIVVTEDNDKEDLILPEKDENKTISSAEIENVKANASIPQPTESYSPSLRLLTGNSKEKETGLLNTLDKSKTENENTLNDDDNKNGSFINKPIDIVSVQTPKMSLDSVKDDKESLKLSIKSTDLESTGKIKNEQDINESLNTVSSPLDRLDPVPKCEGKVHLYQKKSDSNTSRHSRTPSGNVSKDVHPLVDYSHQLTDSEESDWDSDNELSLYEGVIGPSSPLINTKNKNHVDDKIADMNNGDNFEIKSFERKNNAEEEKSVSNENVKSSPVLSVECEQSVEDTQSQVKQPNQQIKDLPLTEEKSNFSVDYTTIDNNKDECQLSHEEKLFQEKNEKHCDGKKDTEMDENDFNEGTLGREDTLHGIEEMWEKNASLDLGISAADSNSSSLSKSASVNTVASKNLVRQNAVNEDDVIKDINDPSESGLTKDAVNEEIQIESKVDQSFMLIENISEGKILEEDRSVNPQTNPDTMNFHPSRKVTEICQHFEGLINVSQTSSDISQRRLSLAAQFLESAPKSHTAQEMDLQGTKKLSYNKPKKDSLIETDSVNQRRYSVSNPITSTPEGINFKGLLMSKQNRRKHLHSESSITKEMPESCGAVLQSTADDINENNSVNAKKRVRKIGLLGKINKSVESEKDFEKANNLSRDASSDKKKRPLIPDVSSDSNSNKSIQHKPSLITSLEKFPGVKKLTKRFSLTSEKTCSQQLLTSKTLAHSLEESTIEDGSVTSSNKNEVEDQEDFVQEVLERLDIRRRSSIGIMNSVIENPRLKKLSHSSSLEILTESNSSLSSCSDSEIFKKVPKQTKSVNIIDQSDSMDEKEMASEGDDGDIDADDDYNDMNMDRFSVHNAETPTSLLKTNDPQSFIKVQNTLQDLCLSLRQEKGERQILEERLKNLICERDDLYNKLDKLHDKHSELQEHTLEMESQLNMSQWELHLAKEQWKICEMNMKKLLENLKKKEEILLKECNLRQQSELCQSSLQNEFSMVSENLNALYNECRSLQSKISTQSLKENSKLFIDCGINTDDNLIESQVEIKEIINLQQKLQESQQLSQKLLAENQCIQESLQQCKQNITASEMKLSEREAKMKLECDQLKKNLETVHEEIKISEEALNQATLSYMKQISNLQNENKLLQDQVEKEQKNFSCLNDQIIALQNQVKATHALLQSSVQKHETECRMIRSEKEELEKKLLHKEEEWCVSLKEKQDLICRLSTGNRKIEELEKILQEKLVTNCSGVDVFNEQITQLQDDLHCIKNHLANNQLQVSEVPKCSSFQSTQTSRGSSPIHQRHIVECCEHCIKLHPPLRPVCFDKTYQTDTTENIQHEILEIRKQLVECKQLVVAEEEKCQTKTIKIETLEEEISNLTKGHQETISQMEHERQKLQTNINHLQQQLQLTNAKLCNCDTNLYQTNSELSAIKKKTTTLENTLTSSQETAKKLENEYTIMTSKWKDACKELDATIKRENNAITSLNEMEKLFQNAKQQIQDLQSMYDESQKNVNDLENQLIVMETQLNKTNETLHTMETEKSLAHQELKEKEKSETEMQATVTQLQLENAQLSQRLLADVTLQQQKWELEARGRTDLAMKLIELEEKQQQSLGLLNKQQQNSSTLLNHNEALHKIIEQERKKNILLQEQILKFEMHPSISKSSPSLSLQYPDHASARNVSIPNEILEQIKDLKKQAEELKLRVKQEKDHRRQCEVQLTKAKKELAEVPQLRKSISYLEDVRKELKGHLSNLQKHIKNHCIDRQEVDKMRQYYEAMTCHTLQTKLGQVQSFFDEQNKVQEHLDQVRLNNEAQVKIDLQRNMNELFEEVTQLRTNLHHSQSQVESLQDQCNRLQELYNNEVQLRSKLSEDLSKAQIKGSDFVLTRKNILKNQKENTKDLKSFDVAKLQLSCLPKNFMSGSEDSILYKLKSELNKSIQLQLSDDFPRNLNVISGTSDQLFSSSKHINETCG